MSLNAPYSLAQEPDGTIQISNSGTNPFWTEQQASSHGLEQQNSMFVTAGKKDGQNWSEKSRESQSNNSYVPPDTVLSKMDHDSRRNLEGANVNDPEASCSAHQSSQANIKTHSEGSKQMEPQRHSVSGRKQSIPEVANDQPKKERPHSLQITTGSGKAATTVDHQGQNPVKGILKKPSGSVSFDTTVQVAESGTASSGEMLLVTTAESTGFSESDYSGIILIVDVIFL